MGRFYNHPYEHIFEFSLLYLHRERIISIEFYSVIATRNYTLPLHTAPPVIKDVPEHICFNFTTKQY